MSKPGGPCLEPSIHADAVTRLLDADVPLIALFAPPGYGKTALARAYAAQFPSFVSVSLPPGTNVLQGLTRVHAELSDSGGDPDATLAELWRRPDAPHVVVLDDLEHLTSGVVYDMLAALIAAMPQHARIVLCSDAEPDFSLTALLAPHLVVTLRRNDLTMPLETMRTAFDPKAELDDSAVYAIYQISQGWPLVARALCRIALDIGIDNLSAVRSHFRWIDLHDWIDTAILRPLEPPLFALLMRCALCADLTRRDVSDGAEEAALLRLRRELQLVDVGITGELRVIPFLRNAIFKQHGDEAAALAEKIFSENKDVNPLRATRVLLHTGKLGEAEEFLAGQPRSVRFELADYAFPGIYLEYFALVKPPYVLYPRLWLGLKPARSFVVSQQQLAEEGVELLTRSDLTPEIREAVLWYTANSFARAGDEERAARYVSELKEALPADAPLAALAEINLDFVRGNYARVVENWERHGTELLSRPRNTRCTYAITFARSSLSAILRASPRRFV